MRWAPTLVCMALLGCASTPPPEPALCPPPSRPPVRQVARPRPHAVTVTRAPIAQTVDVSATLAPATAAPVVAHRSGVARELRVDVGSQVRRGDALAVVGPAHGAAGRRESVRAPIDGVVLERLATPGSPVQSGRTALYTLADVDRLVARAEMPAASAAMLRVGEAAEVRAPSMPDRAFRAVVSRVDPTVTAAGAVAFDLSLANADRALQPGAIVQATVELVRLDDALSVPLDAVVFDGEGARVFVAEDGRARARVVGVGVRQGARIQVVEGLQASDRVLIPARLARDGDPIDAE